MNRAAKLKEDKVGLSQKAILYREDGRILTIRRTKTAPSRPRYWDLPGGEVNFGANVQSEIRREIKEETGFVIQHLKVFDVISGFDDNGEFWVTICYLAQPKTMHVGLSYEHDAFRWVTPSEFEQLLASPRNKKFVERYKSLGARKRRL
ncbi:MAG: NUDIX hydrolase [Candidatus Kerfeldbacteria bacterium]|nr:NUDIX hydrolase [Candidatus Kerfeldbacteria bacterium]